MSRRNRTKKYTPLIIIMLITVAAVLGVAYYVLKDDLYFLQERTVSPDGNITLYIKHTVSGDSSRYRVSQRTDGNKLRYYEWTTDKLETVWADDSSKCAIRYTTGSGNEVTDVLDCVSGKIIQASSMSSLSLRYYMTQTGYELYDEIPVDLKFTGWQGSCMCYKFSTVNTSGVELSGNFDADYSNGFAIKQFARD